MSLRALLIERICARGPLTVAEFMDLALYHPDLGYYARADRRSGRAGDFFTSVDVGPVFGELLTVQLGEMWRILGARGSGLGARANRSDDVASLGSASAQAPGPRQPFDLVEAGAGSGRLARDILDAAAAHDPEFYEAVRLHLVERSPAAQAVQPATLGPHAEKLATTSASPPDEIDGAILANELLDALPTHVVVMSQDGLREIVVDLDGDRLVERTAPLSSPEIGKYLERLGARLRPGWRVEVNLNAVRWVREAARRLCRGFLLLIDYGHEADELYSATQAAGTLTAYRAHAANFVTGEAGGAPWLSAPGECDMTAHVDFTSIRQAAEAEGLDTLGFLDQTYFLLGLGAADRIAAHGGDAVRELKARLAVKTLVLPGGLGSTHKVLILGRGVGRPALRGCSYGTRIT